MADDLAATDIPGTILQPSMSSDDTVATIKKWQSTCRQSHDCVQGTYRPKRLLYVGRCDASHLNLQDCDESSMSNAPEYAALSYIWGGPQRFMALKDNIEVLKAMIELEDLPKTLRDAVLVCRAIGLQWLWIDALCIIQDDQIDKFEQIQTMGQVYQSATLTIVPATSFGSDEGFLADTFENTISPFQRFRYPTSDGSEGSICLIKRQPNGIEFPIETRGWTMQERLLSTRLVFFHPGRIDWVCRESHLFAGSSSSFSVTEIDGSLIETNRLLTEFSPTPSIYSDVQEQIRRWHSLCSTFRTRVISDPLDRLPALSGMAKEFKRMFPEIGDYVAGMWTKNLAQQLLWRIGLDAPYGYRLDKFIGPSWSWASIEGNYMFPTFATMPAKIRMEILDYEIQHIDGSDRYGALSSAFLKVSGRLKTAQWNISTQQIESPDGLLLAGNTKTLPDIEEYTSEGFFAGISMHVYCLEIQDARYWARHIKTDFGPTCTGLLLFKCSDTEPIYERAGVFSLAKVGKDETSYEVIKAAVKNLAWFEDVEPQVITIV